MRREATVKEVAEFLTWLCDNYPELADKKLEVPFDSGCCVADVDYPIFAFTEKNGDDSVILYNWDSKDEDFIREYQDKYTIYER